MPSDGATKSRMEGREFKKKTKPSKIVCWELQKLSLPCSQKGRLLECDLAGSKKMLQRCGHASILRKDSSSLQRHTLVPGPSSCQTGGLSDQPWCECSTPPRPDYFRWTGRDWHMPWFCPCSSQPRPPGALHGTQKHPSEEQGCPRPLCARARK